MHDYFRRLIDESPTRVWVSNPTRDEAELAIEHGAVGATTNPAYCAGLLQRAPGDILPIIDACIPASDDDHVVADLVQRRVIERTADLFAPIFTASAGRAGYVAIQGAPEADVDGEAIWEEARAGRALGPNVAPKIPVTLPGLHAMESVVEAGWPVIVTEVFSLDQVVAACEVYLRVTARTGVRSPFFMSPITGILGDHLKAQAVAKGLSVPAPAMELAGIGLARKCAALVEDRDYPVTLLFGGARVPEDMTALVGSRHPSTIYWSTFAELAAASPPVARTIDAPFDPDVDRLLRRTFPDVERGWELGRLAPEEFEGFGPLQYFREIFAAGWRDVLATIAQRRRLTRAPTR